MLFKFKDGVKAPHQDGDVIYKPGDIIETNRPLDTIHPTKFEKVQEIRPVLARAKAAEPVEVVETPASSIRPFTKQPKGRFVKKVAKPVLEDKVDVTDQYEDAGKKDVKIFKKGDVFQAYDADRPESPLDEFSSEEQLVQWLVDF